MIPPRGLQDNLLDEDSSKTSKSDSESTKGLGVTGLESKAFAPAGIADRPKALHQISILISKFKEMIKKNT